MSDNLNVPAAGVVQDPSEILTVNFTREELSVMVNILDLATKYEGLRIAETTLFLSKKIRESLTAKAV
jgi:hypothetical protein